jgi:hypothetical protein
VVERIAQSDAALGYIVSRCIRTGIFCSYQPNPDLPIAWVFATTGLESAESAPISSGDAAPSNRDYTQVSPAALSIPTFSLAERSLFVGRENESAAIRAAIDRACKGNGSLVMIAGEPGVGKTRLAAEMAAYATAMVSHASLAAATKETNRFHIFLSLRLSKAVWRRQPAPRISALKSATTPPPCGLGDAERP